MGKTRSNDVIKKQDLEVKSLVADDIVAEDLTITNIFGDVVNIEAQRVNMSGGLVLQKVNDLETYVRDEAQPKDIGTMIYSLEESKPLWLAQVGEETEIEFTITSISGGSGSVDVVLESETITFEMTEGDTIQHVVYKMITAINASTYYKAEMYNDSVNVSGKKFITETSEPTITCDVGTVVEATIFLDVGGKPYIFVDGAGTEVEVN